MTQRLDLRLLVLERRPFQLLDLERLLNQCGCFNLATAVDASDLELLLEQGRQFDLLICKESSLSKLQYSREHNLLEHLVSSGCVSRLMFICDATLHEKVPRPSLPNLGRGVAVRVMPPLTPERIRPYLLPSLLQLVKSA